MHAATAPQIDALFQQAFGRPPTVIARAPGRIEFIGNHTDYNGGAVLGAAINRYVTVAAAPNASGKIRLQSAGADNQIVLDRVPAERVTGTDSWINYPLGVWKSLGDFKLPQPTGFDLYVTSDLPAGAGLSSSAALELATALVLLKLAGHPGLPPAQLAALGRHADRGGLDHATQFLQVAQEFACQSGLGLPHDHVGIEPIPCILGQHAGADLGPGRHQPFGHQRFDRLTDHRAADAQLLAELGLGRHGTTGCVTPGDAGFTEVIHRVAVHVLHRCHGAFRFCWGFCWSYSGRWISYDVYEASWTKGKPESPCDRPTKWRAT